MRYCVYCGHQMYDGTTAIDHVCTEQRYCSACGVALPIPRSHHDHAAAMHDCPNALVGYSFQLARTCHCERCGPSPVAVNEGRA